jgi:hypothetical protein
VSTRTLCRQLFNVAISTPPTLEYVKLASTKKKSSLKILAKFRRFLNILVLHHVESKDSILTLGWSKIEICKNQQELWSKELRTLIRKNFHYTTFQNFECGWPRPGLEDRKNCRNTQKKNQYFGDFFKS